MKKGDLILVKRFINNVLIGHESGQYMGDVEKDGQEYFQFLSITFKNRWFVVLKSDFPQNSHINNQGQTITTVYSMSVSSTAS